MAEDVMEGLSSTHKYLSSKYFYDDEGSRLFQKIMALPEYYLTNCELEILQTQGQEIYNSLHFDGHFNVVELGAGDGSKTVELLKAFTQAGADFTYVPVDISEEAISFLQNKLSKNLPVVKTHPKVGDYFEMLEEIQSEHVPSLVLFLGSNIGNYPYTEAMELLLLIQKQLRAQDKLLIGYDLKKNPHTIAAAYNDTNGITRAFNMNLLTRFNRELGADFNLDQFEFYSHYNPETGAVKSYLVSLIKQEVYFNVLEKSFHFEKNELIYTELSRKYSLNEIEEMASKTGYSCTQHFQDKRNFFSDSLLCKETHS